MSVSGVVIRLVSLILRDRQAELNNGSTQRTSMKHNNRGAPNAPNFANSTAITLEPSIGHVETANGPAPNYSWATTMA